MTQTVVNRAIQVSPRSLTVGTLANRRLAHLMNGPIRLSAEQSLNLVMDILVPMDAFVPHTIVRRDVNATRLLTRGRDVS